MVKVADQEKNSFLTLGEILKKQMEISRLKSKMIYFRNLKVSKYLISIPCLDTCVKTQLHSTVNDRRRRRRRKKVVARAATSNDKNLKALILIAHFMFS